MCPAQLKPSFHFPQQFQIFFTWSHNTDLASDLSFPVSAPSFLLCANETMTSTSHPPNINLRKPHRHRGCLISYKIVGVASEKQRDRDLASAKPNRRWWNLGFPSATPVGSKLGSMPMAKCLWLATTAIFPSAKLALISKSVRVAESVWDVALPIKVNPSTSVSVYVSV